MAPKVVRKKNNVEKTSKVEEKYIFITKRIYLIVEFNEFFVNGNCLFSFENSKYKNLILNFLFPLL